MLSSFFFVMQYKLLTGTRELRTSNYNTLTIRLLQEDYKNFYNFEEVIDKFKNINNYIFEKDCYQNGYMRNYILYYKLGYSFDPEKEKFNSFVANLIFQ